MCQGHSGGARLSRQRGNSVDRGGGGAEPGVVLPEFLSEREIADPGVRRDRDDTGRTFLAGMGRPDPRLDGDRPGPLECVDQFGGRTPRGDSGRGTDLQGVFQPPHGRRFFDCQVQRTAVSRTIEYLFSPAGFEGVERPQIVGDTLGTGSCPRCRHQDDGQQEYPRRWDPRRLHSSTTN